MVAFLKPLKLYELLPGVGVGDVKIKLSLQHFDTNPAVLCVMKEH